MADFKIRKSHGLKTFNPYNGENDYYVIETNYGDWEISYGCREYGDGKVHIYDNGTEIGLLEKYDSFAKFYVNGKYEDTFADQNENFASKNLIKCMVWAFTRKPDWRMKYSCWTYTKSSGFACHKGNVYNKSDIEIADYTADGETVKFSTCLDEVRNRTWFIMLVLFLFYICY